MLPELIRRWQARDHGFQLERGRGCSPLRSGVLVQLFPNGPPTPYLPGFGRGKSEKDLLGLCAFSDGNVERMNSCHACPLMLQSCRRSAFDLLAGNWRRTHDPAGGWWSRGVDEKGVTNGVEHSLF
jgi:hypothetical protein